jgi:hypothetical protein
VDIALPELAAVAEGVKPLLDWRGVPVDLASLAALAAGLGWASGLRLYALVFVLGALARFAGVQLPGGLGVLAHPLVLGSPACCCSSSSLPTSCPGSIRPGTRCTPSSASRPARRWPPR